MSNDQFKNSGDFLFNSVRGRDALAIATEALADDPELTPGELHLRVVYELGCNPRTGVHEDRPGLFKLAEIATIYAVTNQYEADFSFSEG